MVLAVLVVEDDPLAADLVRRQVERLGHRVEVVHDGGDAVETLATTGIDVVLMDLHMGHLDGDAATRAIRAMPGTGEDVTIIGLTASRPDLARAECLRAGMDDVLTKPVGRVDLARLLGRVDGLRRPSSEGPRGADDPQVRVVLDRLADEVGSTDIVTRAVRRFVAELDDLVEGVVTAADPDRRRRAAHRLRGSALQLGAGRLAEIAAELEGAPAGGVPALLDRLRADAVSARRSLLAYVADPPMR